jgi:hypothetical protein
MRKYKKMKNKDKIQLHDNRKVFYSKMMARIRNKRSI